MQRIAIIFDNTQRPETTGVYCRRALEQRAQAGRIAEVKHFLPCDLHRIPAKRFDLFLYVDDGLNGQLRDDLRPAVWWAIDTHVSFDRCLEKAQQADVTFAAQRNGVEQLRASGIENVSWLPLACDPELHGRRHIPIEYDVAFVGNLVPGPRLSLLQLLQQCFPHTFIGRGYFEEMAEIYSSSRTVFNRSIRDDVNMRVFEGLCSGSLLVTNDLSENGQNELFRDGEHCATYRNEEELLDKLRYYLTHDAIRERIATAGREAAISRHTYRQRMETVLEQVSRKGKRKLVSVASPLARDRTYFEFDRPDVLELVPVIARRVLDIGCGAGRLGASIKQRQPAHVTGIELDADAAAHARQTLDEVVPGNVQQEEVEFAAGSFDCVICADVLEHLESPQLVLEKVRRWLAPGGCLVTSIPNIRHHTVVKSLLAGNWTYAPAGLLDQDHVRFFTRRSIEKLLFQSGFSVDEQRIVAGEGFREWVAAGRPRSVQAGELQVETASVGDAEEFFAYQYLFRSTPVEREASLTSIVLVTHNQLAYTRACLDSLFRHTPEPFELIVVDNASTDGTIQYVGSLGVRLIRNNQNRGFPAAVNQGIRAATGDAILLLNNDTLLTTGWLERLRAALHSDEQIGLVGPCTNCTAGPQRIDVAYDLTSLDDFAWDWRRTRFGQVQKVPELTGFCLLIDRRVLDAVGLLDERFENGVYEDIDYCLRAREAGFDLAIAADAFVHHFGHKSYQGAGVDQDQVAAVSEVKFREKWNLPETERADVAPATRRRISHTPRSLRRNDEIEPLRKILELVPDDAEQVLVFVREEGDLLPCEQLRQMLGAQVTLCPLQLIEDLPFEQLPPESLDDQRERFDAVIIPHLDHHRQPAALLESVHRLLRPGGELICHARNVRSREQVEALIRGTWTVDWRSPQLRFFTRREFEKLLFTANFQIDGWRPLHGPDFAAWRATRESDAARIGSMSLRGMPSRDVEELFTSEFVVRAAKQAAPDDGLTSIVIVTHNQWSYTKACIDSIRLRTTVPYELIVVDNGSTDQTLPWLRSQQDVRLIQNAENRGFPAAANQGIQAASGAQILLLNNDTVVTTGWLRRQLEALYSNESIGLVGPVSNHVSGEQQVDLHYPSLDQLDGAAWDWGAEHAGQRIPTDRLVGFCLLLKRQVIDKIGLLDEQFGIGNFEDDDLCRRAKDAGFRAVIARDAFVHHFGSVTFRATGVDFAAVLNENRQKYLDKWNGNHLSPSANGMTHAEPISNGAPSHDSSLRNGFTDHTTNIPIPPDVQTTSGPRPRFLCDVSDEGALLLKPNNVRLSACLIVRDNEQTIRPCLESLKPWVDEIIIVDTGSRDRTPRICAELGARLFHWSWKDSFSAPRNVSFDLARGEWIFWMDSDDTLPEECGRRLRDLVLRQSPQGTDRRSPFVADAAMNLELLTERRDDRSEDPRFPDLCPLSPDPRAANLLGYVIQVHCPGDDPHDLTVVDHVKLIRNRPDLRFEFRIHEQILPAIRRAGGDVAWTDIHVLHSGSDRTPAGRQRKLERDFHLLHLDLEEHPDHPFTLFNLGMTHADAGQHQQAVQYLQRCLDVSGPEESHLRKAYALLVGSLSASGKHPIAWDRCREGSTKFPDDPELLFRTAMLQHQTGQLEAAAATYERLLNGQRDRHFTSIDAGLTSHKARHNLAVVYDELGRSEDAERQWRRILGDAPTFGPAFEGLAQLLMKRQAWTDLDSLMAGWPPGGWNGTTTILAARKTVARGDWEQACGLLRRQLEESPEDLELHHELCQLLFNRARPQETAEALERLAVLAPQDAAVHHNLGSARMWLGDFTGAVAALSRSLQLRPEAPETRRQLAEARLAARQVDSVPAPRSLVET